MSSTPAQSFQSKPAAGGLSPAAALLLAAVGLAIPFIAVLIAVPLLREHVSVSARPVALFLVIDLAMVVAMPFLGATLIVVAWDRRGRLARSLPTLATVVGLTEVPKGRNAPLPRPILRFQDGRGLERESTALIGRPDLVIGVEVEAWFDAQDPSWVVVDGRDPAGVRMLGIMFAAFVGLLLVVAGGAALLLLLR